jgi:hypothetical protein
MHLQAWGMFDDVDARFERGNDGGESPQEGMSNGTYV